MRTENWDITIRIRDVPSDDESAVEMELVDVLEAINQLPYDFECSFKQNGSWL